MVIILERKIKFHILSVILLFLAIHHICYNNLTVFFLFLIDFNFYIQDNSNYTINAVLSDRFHNNTNNHNQIKNLLIDFVNAKCDEGNTPIMYAVFRGNLRIIQKLLEYNVNINEVNKNGNSLMHISIIADQVNIMVYLKDKLNLSIYITDKIGSTPLHFACFLGSENCLNVLLSWIHDVNVKNEEGNTPLHYLVFSGKKFLNNKIEKSKLIKKLVMKGADLNIKNNKGLTALDLARSRNITNIVDMLTNEEFGTINSQMLKLNTFSGNAHKSKYSNVIAFIILHIVCIFQGYFILCQGNYIYLIIFIQL